MLSIPSDLKGLLEVTEGFEIEKEVKSLDELLALQFENEDGELEALKTNKSPVFSMLEGSTHFIVNSYLVPNDLKQTFAEFGEPDYYTVV